jgi:hypothetical protein
MHFDFCDTKLNTCIDTSIKMRSLHVHYIDTEWSPRWELSSVTFRLHFAWRFCAEGDWGLKSTYDLVSNMVPCWLGGRGIASVCSQREFRFYANQGPSSDPQHCTITKLYFFQWVLTFMSIHCDTISYKDLEIKLNNI